MGRYLTGDVKHKFWFGVQDSNDILEFGLERESIQAVIYFEDSEKIKSQVVGYKKEFKEKFKISYDDFIKKIDEKGYLTSSNDRETNTEKWNNMSKKASLIELGDKIIKSLEEKGDDLYVDAEI